jgi:hypothetical protein
VRELPRLAPDATKTRRTRPARLLLRGGSSMIPAIELCVLTSLGRRGEVA